MILALMINCPKTDEWVMNRCQRSKNEAIISQHDLMHQFQKNTYFRLTKKKNKTSLQSYTNILESTIQVQCILFDFVVL